MNIKVIFYAVLAGALLTLPRVSPASGTSAAIAPQQDTAASGDAAGKLNKKQFQNVKVTVDANGIATLTGSVDLYEYKSDAAKRVMHAKGVVAVRNEIQVAGPGVSDKDLRSKLGEELAYDRVGYGNVFNAITLQVADGVVTLGGHAHNYVDKDSALALAATMPGVKDVVDEIEVDPLSSFDDRIRIEEARAIYGFPSLNKYAIDPARPIRIAVQNGNVELYGIVDSQADKDAAFIRAKTVPGVFDVKNYLAVANQAPESSK